MTLTLYNVRHEMLTNNPIQMSRVYGSNTINRYKLLQTVYIELSNGSQIIIPSGYIWDLSSVPRFAWSICPPDGDFQIAALIHDFLYENRLFTRKFADKEMLLWSKSVSGTAEISIRNIDNYTRYYAVRLFGKSVWNN